MTYVELREGEVFDSLLRRWKHAMDRAGVVREYKRHLRFRSASERRWLKQAEARRRRERKAMHSRRLAGS